MDFPHLSDTRFPNLSTVDVYRFQNEFDYSRWNEKSLIKLCNVLWNSTYADVVKFDTDEERDSWFDGLSDYWALELQQAARVVPEGYVKLPVPYDVMARYNYLFIDMPIATSPEQPLPYENGDGIRRWYFFVNDIQYLSPNATQVYVSPDIWTNFQNRIEIPYMLLERGHAPVAASDTAQYLANPIANNRYLLAPDVNFDNAGITRSSSYVPFGNGMKYVCIATTVSPDLISSLGSVSASSAYEPGGTITYSDTSEYWGHQIEVNGLTMGNGYDYSNANTPAKTGRSDGLIGNNLTVYAVSATDCYGNGTFFDDVSASCPQFLTTVQACFVVDDACITRGTKYTIAGHDVWQCVGKSSTLLEKSLAIADFGYPQELQRFAKLYTAPYARLEITDNDGTTYDVNIEETTTLSVKAVVSVAFPYINERVYLEGIGGVGSKSYSWVDLNGSSASLQMPESDWFKYCFDWKIPTFALYMNGQTAFMLETFNRNVKQAIQQGVVNYHVSMRSANTARENAFSAADVAYLNVQYSTDTARTNAYDSADTGQTNAYDAADLAKTNTDNSADAAYNNVDRTCTAQSDNLTARNAGIYYNEEMAITTSDTITGYNNALGTATTNQANSVMVAATLAQNEVTGSTNLTSNVGNLIIGGVNGASQGVIMGAAAGGTVGAAAGGVAAAPGFVAGALAGATIGLVGGTVQAVMNDINTAIITDSKSSIVQLQKDANTALNAENIATANDIRNVERDCTRRTYEKNIDVSVAQQNTLNTASRANASEIQSTTKTNATNAQTTAKANADRTRTTSRTNAGRVYTTDRGNALRTHDNVQANANYTRECEEASAKEILENGKYASMAAINDSRNTAPVRIGEYSGNPTADYMRTRGVQIKVKTQSDSAIRQAGDVFARFGYALNQIWDVQSSGLKLMQHFTYWKATEIWVNDASASNNLVNTTIRQMFMSGVTIWNNPTEIGAINVYSN